MTNHGDFNKGIYCRKDQQGRNKTGRTERESGELLGEFVERNIVAGAIETETNTKNRIKKKGVDKLGWFISPDINCTIPYT